MGIDGEEAGDDRSAAPPEGSPTVASGLGSPEETEGGRPAQPAVAAAWDRLPEESERAFAAAAAYFEMGPERDEKDLPGMGEWTDRQISKWRHRYRWDERAQAYDESRTHESRDVRAGLHHGATREGASAAGKPNAKWAARREEIREREWRAASLLQSMGERVLEHQLGQIEATPHTARDAVLLIVKASELGRRAAEMPTRFSDPGRNRRDRSAPRTAGTLAAGESPEGENGDEPSTR